MFGNGTNSRIAVLESWKADHDHDCERRYVAIESKLEKIEQKFEGQTSDIRLAFKEHSLGIFKLLWTVLTMLIVAMATLLYNLIPGLHLAGH